MNPSLAYINWMIDHHGYNYFLIPSFPTGLTPYPGLFFFFVSYNSVFLGLDPFYLYWYSVYPLIFCYMSLIFLITLKISRNNWLSLTSSFVAFFTSVALAEVVRNPLYLTLDMMGQLFFLLIMLFHFYYNGVGKRIITILSVCLLILFNYLTALLIFPFLLYFLIDEKKIPFIGDGRQIFRITSVGLTFFIPAILFVINAIYPRLSSEFAPISQELSVYYKVRIIGTNYPLYFWLLFSLALISITISFIYNNKNKSYYLDILLYVCCGLVIFAFPVWMTYRFEFYVRIFLAIFISAMLNPLDSKNFIIKLTGNAFKKFKPKEIRLKTILSVLLLIITVVSMFPAFTNYASNFLAFISAEEYEAAKWIEQNTPASAYILTDDSSGYVIRGLTLRNSSTYFVLPDGRMPAISSSLYPDLKDQLYAFFTSNSLQESVEILEGIPFEQMYIVVTSRTVSWVQGTIDSVYTSPRELANYSQVINKFSEPYFFEMFSYDTIKIYKPNPGLSVENVTVWSDDTFSENWTWYLDGAYGDYSYESNGNTAAIITEAKSSSNSWVGLRTNLNCSGSTFLEIKSKIDLSPYLLQIILSNSNGTRIATFNRGNRQSSLWITNRISLTTVDTEKVDSLSLIIWTQDDYKHTWELDYIKFGYLEIKYEK